MRKGPPQMFMVSVMAGTLYRIYYIYFSMLAYIYCIYYIYFSMLVCMLIESYADEKHQNFEQYLCIMTRDQASTQK